MGSQPVEIPNIVAILPVGAQVNNWELHNPRKRILLLSSWYRRLFSLVLSAWKKGVSTTFVLNIGYAPLLTVSSLELSKAEKIISVPIILIHLIDSSLPYLIPSFINMSANPITPNPICLQFLTDSLCSIRGCNGRPSSSTSFNATTAFLTVSLNPAKSNVSHSVTNSARFILPNKHDPPLGKGSSNLLS